MLEGKDLLLATRKYAKEDRKKSWFLFLSTFSLMIAAYAGAVVSPFLIPQIIFSILAGLISVRLFIIYHDYLHNSILQDSFFAKTLFMFYGLFMLTPTSIWKRSHDYHHANNAKLYTTSIGSFPLVTKKEFLAASKSERAKYLFVRNPFTIAFGYFFAFLWGMCIRTLLVNPKKHLDTFFAIVFHYGIGFTIYYFFGFQSFFFGFFFPTFFNCALGAYLFYAQHNFPGATYNNKEGWDYTHAALYSSSFMKMSGIMHWFTGNIGYHHIHHLNHKIPFYNLPKAFNEMIELQKPVVTSLSPSDIYKCLTLKVWDPENGKMIGLKEVYA